MMGSNKISKQCGFDNIEGIFPFGIFIQDIFEELIFCPLKEIGIITFLKYTLTEVSCNFHN